MIKANRPATRTLGLLAGGLLVAHMACGTSPLTETPPDASPDTAVDTPDTASPAEAGDASVVDARDASVAESADAADASVADAADAADVGVDASPPPPPNILLVIGDDIGLDSSVCHTVSADPGRAPRILDICNRGVVFDNVWSAPLCSPTRATIMTGRHGFRTTVGTAGSPLPLTERALPLALTEGNPVYTAGAVGKWHLSNATNGGANHPNTVGFAHYSGNLQAQVASYTSWSRVVNGVSGNVTDYATTVAVNDARDWIAAQSNPWLMWLAFNAGHAPFHLPPAGLHTYTTLSGPPLPARPVDHYHAMIEAMDTELGRLIDGIPPAVMARTWIIYVGDNGTPQEVSKPPIVNGKAKGSLYQGGVRVPLAIVGPGVVAGGRRVSALVHTVDIFKTVLELANVDMATALPAGGNTVDSVSLVPYLKQPAQAPLRPWVMTEQFGASGFGAPGKTIRDQAFKMIRFDSGVIELYDLRTDPWETENLIAAGPLSAEAQTHLDSLTLELDTLLASP